MLGIAGFVVFPLVPSIIAIVLGNSARREIAERPGLGGAGMATAGILLGWIGVGLGILTGLILLYFAAVVSSMP